MPAYLTLNQVESDLIVRCGQRMALVGFPTTPTDYAASPPVLNPATLEAINTAADQLGVAVTTFGRPTDADLGGITAGDVARKLIDLAELRLLQNVVGNWNQNIKISETVQSRSITRADHLKSIQDRITQLSTLYQGYLTPFVPGGSIGRIHHEPITAYPPRWFPGAGRRPFGPWGGRGGW